MIANGHLELCLEVILKKYFLRYYHCARYLWYFVQLTQQIKFSMQDEFATYAKTQTDYLISKNIFKKETIDLKKLIQAPQYTCRHAKNDLNTHTMWNCSTLQEYLHAELSNRTPQTRSVIAIKLWVKWNSRVTCCYEPCTCRCTTGECVNITPYNNRNFHDDGMTTWC